MGTVFGPVTILRKKNGGKGPTVAPKMAAESGGEVVQYRDGEGLVAAALDRMRHAYVLSFNSPVRPSVKAGRHRDFYRIEVSLNRSAKLRHSDSVVIARSGFYF